MGPPLSMWSVVGYDVIIWYFIAVARIYMAKWWNTGIRIQFCLTL
jgi:hypothetical protein